MKVCINCGAFLGPTVLPWCDACTADLVAEGAAARALADPTAAAAKIDNPAEFLERGRMTG